MSTTNGKKYNEFDKATSISKDDLVLISQRNSDGEDNNTLASMQQIKDLCGGGNGTKIVIAEDLPTVKEDNTLYFKIKDKLTTTISTNKIKAGPNMGLEVIE